MVLQATTCRLQPTLPPRQARAHGRSSGPSLWPPGSWKTRPTTGGIYAGATLPEMRRLPVQRATGSHPARPRYPWPVRVPIMRGRLGHRSGGARSGSKSAGNEAAGHNANPITSITHLTPGFAATNTALSQGQREREFLQWGCLIRKQNCIVHAKERSDER